jgi:Protein of unknown function (DUF3311)
MPSTPPTSSPSTQPPQDDPAAATGARSNLVVSPWNLLLLLPLAMLVTPWFNHATPTLGGLPFFYWYQFVFVIVGVGSVWIVYAATKRKSLRTRTADRLGVDELDEGDRA